jgi:AMMECR1 domain-containing protein
MDLDISDKSLLEKKSSCFVTFYKVWEIRGSAWTVKESKANIVEELIDNTIAALNDSRFPKVKASEAKDLKIRIDLLSDKERTIIQKQEDFDEINPVKFWIIVIKKDYEKLAVILPNIDSKLFSASDLKQAISNKLWEEFELKNYITYKIKTETISDF